tara:strand:+ start:51 stop:467 length:417 start_codon:yes stop_codon:yes gene_type:complete
MSDLKDTRKLTVKRENHNFLKDLKKNDLIKEIGDGFLVGVSYALKNGLKHEDIKKPRDSGGGGADANIDDAESFNSIQEMKDVLAAIYPEKYNDREVLNYPHRLLNVLADAGLDQIKENCWDSHGNIESSVFTDSLKL